MVGSLVAKLFGRVMESKVRELMDKLDVNIATPLITLSKYYKRKLSQGKGLYCCFIGSRKVFEMLPCEQLMRGMEEL